jgi:2',3'-cyclic-nucleotide 2'-phosphodiesterase (5'-nucleotidase family)
VVLNGLGTVVFGPLVTSGSSRERLAERFNLKAVKLIEQLRTQLEEVQADVREIKRDVRQLLRKEWPVLKSILLDSLAGKNDDQCGTIITDVADTIARRIVASVAEVQKGEPDYRTKVPCWRDLPNKVRTMIHTAEICYTVLRDLPKGETLDWFPTVAGYVKAVEVIANERIVCPLYEM